MQNCSRALQFLTATTCEQLNVCTARGMIFFQFFSLRCVTQQNKTPHTLDIVSTKADKICALLEYIRDKFDLDFLFTKVVSEQQGDIELEEGIFATIIRVMSLC